MKTIGAADEFWRVRITRLDTTDDMDFEWHDDVLYREPATAPVVEVELFKVEAVRIGDPDVVVGIGTFDDRDEAETFIGRVREDLIDMTKSQFETAYIEAAAGHSDADTTDDPQPDRA